MAAIPRITAVAASASLLPSTFATLALGGHLSCRCCCRASASVVLLSVG